MQIARRAGPFMLLSAFVLIAPLDAGAQPRAPREGPSVALAAGSVAASGERGARPLGSLALRLVLPSSPLVLRADASGGARATDPAIATAALGVRVLQVESASLYLLGGVGAYAGANAKRSGRNVGGGIEVRPSALRGHAAFLEGRAHAWFRSDALGRHAERLTTIVAGLWW